MVIITSTSFSRWFSSTLPISYFAFSLKIIIKKELNGEDVVTFNNNVKNTAWWGCCTFNNNMKNTASFMSELRCSVYCCYLLGIRIGQFEEYEIAWFINVSTLGLWELHDPQNLHQHPQNLHHHQMKQNNNYPIRTTSCFNECNFFVDATHFV